MGEPEWSRIRKLLEEAIERPAEERAAFLDHACASEPDATELRREVESLLAHEEEVDFLEDEPSSSAPAGETLGQFRIIQEIGRGATSIVYEPEQRNPQRRVALSRVILPRRCS